MKRFLIILIIGAFTAGSFTDCSSVHKQKMDQKKRARQFEKEKEKRLEQDAEAYRAARERHRDIQTRSARREMKKNQRLSQRHNAQEREFFLVRWFKHKKSDRRRQPGSRR